MKFHGGDSGWSGSGLYAADGPINLFRVGLDIIRCILKRKTKNQNFDFFIFSDFLQFFHSEIHVLGADLELRNRFSVIKWTVLEAQKELRDHTEHM